MYNNNEFLEILNKKFPEYLQKYDILEGYKGNKVPIQIKCKVCTSIFLMDPMHILRGQGCPNCNHGKKDNQWFISKVNNLVGNDYSILNEYTRGKDKVHFRHNLCGNEFYMRAQDFLNGEGCPQCSKKIAGLRRRKSTSKFISEVDTLTNGEYSVVGEYIGNHEKIKIKHNICGTIFEVEPSAFLYSNGQREIGTRCPHCRGTFKKTEGDLFKEIAELDPDYEYITGTYINAQEHFKVKHKSCGNVYEATMTNFKKGCRCPHCAYRESSKQEQELTAFIHQYCPNATKKRFYPNEHNRRIFIEADIVIEELKLIIEYNGIYWHSTAQGKGSKYHLNKLNYFNKLGYRAIQIFEDEWVLKKDIVKRRLAQILASDKGTVKDYMINNITIETGLEFIQEYSLEEKSYEDSMAAGLYSNNILLAVLIYKLSDDKMIINSFFSLYDGCLKPIINFCIRNNNIDKNKIEAQLNLCWNDRNSNEYTSAGFYLSKVIEPSCWSYNGLSKVLNEGSIKNPQFKKSTLYVYDCGYGVYSRDIKKKES